MNFWVKVKKVMYQLMVIVVIAVLIFSPYLLIVDFKQYSPFVVTVWVISILYYLFVKSKNE